MKYDARFPSHPKLKKFELNRGFILVKYIKSMRRELFRSPAVYLYGNNLPCLCFARCEVAHQREGRIIDLSESFQKLRISWQKS